MLSNCPRINRKRYNIDPGAFESIWSRRHEVKSDFKVSYLLNVQRSLSIHTAPSAGRASIIVICYSSLITRYRRAHDANAGRKSARDLRPRPASARN
ncbi:hypothetical protein EVAR_66874_1 [Eumeta japonica]|uniref:Uncharacterized protein n=1 Tax=Eumeta variegata TaxID=151549 RepID=A0A4C2A2H1_EUMVA|nr:hypothetical protein EVAR_66874_1 [Eumeta japonica]